jgi:menaquinone-9 beta-reductase
LEAEQEYDIAVVGGGLAGLSLASLLAKEGVRVLVLEKESYPRQKVCGEYISNESRDFLERNQLLSGINELPQINRFELTFPRDENRSCRLEPGGFGISRWKLDAHLCEKARQNGAEVVENTLVTTIEERKEGYEITSREGEKFYTGRLIGATGRYSHRLFPANSEKKTGAGKWFGVKYHIRHEFPGDTIQINLFPGGYAGISKVEDGKYCFCYLASAHWLKKYAGNIEQIEKNVLSENPTVKSHLEQFSAVEGPFTTARFDFSFRAAVHSHRLYLGDTAGFIPPLTGNGMSLAFRSAATASELILQHLEGKKRWQEVETAYARYGKQYLGSRIKSGVFLQNLALNPSAFFQRSLSAGMFLFPPLLKSLSKKATGKNF